MKFSKSHILKFFASFIYFVFMMSNFALVAEIILNLVIRNKVFNANILYFFFIALSFLLIILQYRIQLEKKTSP